MTCHPARAGGPLLFALALQLALVLLLAAPAFAQPPADEMPAEETPAAETPVEETPIEETPEPPQETVCDDGVDDDEDGLTDCADADCYAEPTCEAGGHEERNDERCSDYIDNDGDGALDCDDSDCSGPGITVCSGSWTGPTTGPAAALGGPDELPELSGDMSVEDLIGRGGDADGERNDYLCSDGIDNDGDGRTDCQDFGCRFDPSVTICASAPGIRFSVVAGIAGAAVFQETPDVDGDGMREQLDPTGSVRFTRIQLRALGQIPFIENSFFLLNLRVERQVRMTFATFNVPIGPNGHYIAINSGSGALSPGLIVSTAKQPLLDPPFYLFNAFERSNGAALEVGGPVTSDNLLRYRVFALGGSGEFNGNVGGFFFRSDESENFTYGGGGQLQLNIVGNYDRFDTPFLYTEVPLTVALIAGARFDQRAVERYTAWNAFATARLGRFSIRAETYGQYIFDFEGINLAFNVQASILLIPRTLMLAVDGGGFFNALEYLPSVVDRIGGFSSQFRRPLDEWQVRGALHWYYFRNIGILSLLYALRIDEENPDNPTAPITEHEVRLEAQFRF